MAEKQLPKKSFDQFFGDHLPYWDHLTMKEWKAWDFYMRFFRV